MFCNKCGIPLPDDARFCNECGHPVKPLPTEGTGYSPASSQPVYTEPVQPEMSEPQFFAQSQTVQIMDNGNSKKKWSLKKKLLVFGIPGGVILLGAIAAVLGMLLSGNDGTFKKDGTALDFVVESFFDESAEAYMPVDDDAELDDYKIDRIVEACPEFEENGLFENPDTGITGYMYLGEHEAIFDGRGQLSEPVPVYCSIVTFFDSVMFVNFHLGSIDYAEEQTDKDFPEDFGEAEAFEYKDIDKCFDKMEASLEKALGEPVSRESGDVDWEAVSLVKNDDGIDVIFSVPLF